MNEIKLVIYGEPVAQGRPRFTTVGGYPRAVDPQKSRNYKQLARFYITQYLKKIQGYKPLKNALCVELMFHVSIPSSWSKKKRMEAAQGVIRPIVRNGDLDNMIKCVLDSANGLLWADDCVITDLHAKKRYTADLARVEITVTEVQ